MRGGGLIRGSRGEIHEVFAINCGLCTCTWAELLAVQRGLIIAWASNYKQVIVSVDSEVVVKLLVRESPASSPFIHIIRRCQAFMARKEWVVKIEHCYRETNRAADWLANRGVFLDQKMTMFEAIPKDLHAILLEDHSGVAWSRSVPT